jgi:hypothetical protein
MPSFLEEDVFGNLLFRQVNSADEKSNLEGTARYG